MLFWTGGGASLGPVSPTPIAVVVIVCMLSLVFVVLVLFLVLVALVLYFIRSLSSQQKDNLLNVSFQIRDAGSAKSPPPISLYHLDI